MSYGLFSEKTHQKFLGFSEGPGEVRFGYLDPIFIWTSYTHFAQKGMFSQLKIRGRPQKCNLKIFDFSKIFNVNFIGFLQVFNDISLQGVSQVVCFPIQLPSFELKIDLWVCFTLTKATPTQILKKIFFGHPRPLSNFRHCQTR